MLDPEDIKMDNFNFPLKDKSIHLFAIPKDYFNNFPSEIADIIHLMDQQDPIFNGTKEVSFSIPDNYFTDFPQKMIHSLKLEENHRQSFLSTLPKAIPYSLPENYFENFEEELFVLLGFFQSEVTEEDPNLEINELSPLLAQLKEKKTYEAPAHYFDQPKKVVEFKPRRKAEQSIQWMRWAAAAMIIALFSFGGWQFLNAPNIVEGNKFADLNQELSNIPDEAIKEYLNTTLNDYELTVLAQNGEVGSKLNSNSAFDGISDSEIKSYLETISY